MDFGRSPSLVVRTPGRDGTAFQRPVFRLTSLTWDWYDVSVSIGILIFCFDIGVNISSESCPNVY